MRRLSMMLAATLVLLATTGRPASAQDDDEIAGYFGLHSTVAAFAPIAPNLGRQALALRGHYARHEMFNSTTNVFAAGVDFGIMPRSSLGFTVGNRDVTDGDSHLFFGAQLAGNLYGLWTPPGEGTSIAVSYELQGGYASMEDDVSSLGFSASLPIAFPFRGRTTSFIPFVTPGLGWGRVNFDGDNASSVRAMLSGGAGLEFANGIGIHGGARYVFADDADLLWGVGVSWRAR